MGLMDALKRAFGRERVANRVLQDSGGAAQPPEPEEEPRVPEISPEDLLAAMGTVANGKMLMLDCREHYERAQSYIPDSVHIPMNSIPMRLGELDREKDILVYCAHGNRSYGVAGWLNQQGFRAVSLKGGIVDWQLRGGPVESPLRKRT